MRGGCEKRPVASASAAVVVVALGVTVTAGCGSAPLDAVAIDPSSLGTGLVAHWTFDDGNGTTVTDTSGNGHHGVLTGGSWEPTGRFGGALKLGSGDSVSVAGFPQATASWTVSVWTRSSAAGLAANTADFSTIISTEKQYSGGWEVHLDNRPNYRRYDAAYWAGRTIDDYVRVFCACIQLDRWIHIATVWDNDAAKMTFYVDDQIMNQVPMPSPILNGDATLYIGTWNQTGRYFIGDVDDFAVWGRALRPPEISALSSAPPQP